MRRTEDSRPAPAGEQRRTVSSAKELQEQAIQSQAAVVVHFSAANKAIGFRALIFDEAHFPDLLSIKYNLIT